MWHMKQLNKGGLSNISILIPDQIIKVNKIRERYTEMSNAFQCTVVRDIITILLTGFVMIKLYTYRVPVLCDTSQVFICTRKTHN